MYTPYLNKKMRNELISTFEAEIEAKKIGELTID
jgi:hypothetical protein